MEREKYNQQAAELADIMLATYGTAKYDRTYNLWSFAFFWNCDKLGEYSVANSYREFIPETFRISKEEAKKPESLIPKATSTVGHFSMLSMANRDLIEKVYTEALENASYSKIEDAVAVVSDKRLIEEVLEIYAELKEKRKLDEKIDLFNFLLRYDITKEKIIPTAKPQGTYLNLTTRLVYRYGEEDLEDGIFSIANSELSERAKLLHCSALTYKETEPDENLLALYLKYANGNNLFIVKPERTSKVYIPGPRRVRVNGNNVSIDWSAVAANRKRKILSYQAFNIKDVLKARIEKTLTERYLNLYRKPDVSHDDVLRDIDNNIAVTSDEEKEVLNRVRRKFEIMGKFKDFNINHRMPVTIIRQGE
ncbi:hypothetical protein J4230_00245 [Candidatus Woesearchaeota archaeon]|nr:hypothetical protein [Candidatus Woesearchaeota archaeon]